MLFRNVTSSVENVYSLGRPRLYFYTPTLDCYNDQRIYSVSFISLCIMLNRHVAYREADIRHNEDIHILSNSQNIISAIWQNVYVFSRKRCAYRPKFKLKDHKTLNRPLAYNWLISRMTPMRRLVVGRSPLPLVNSKYRIIGLLVYIIIRQQILRFVRFPTYTVGY